MPVKHTTLEEVPIRLSAASNQLVELTQLLEEDTAPILSKMHSKPTNIHHMAWINHRPKYLPMGNLQHKLRLMASLLP